jgi:hypothetical protein
MEELLNRVSERMGLKRDGDATAQRGRSIDVGIGGTQYESALNSILALLHESEQLHDLLRRPGYRDLPMDQIEDLLSVLDKVQRELRRCEVELQR